MTRLFPLAFLVIALCAGCSKQDSDGGSEAEPASKGSEGGSEASQEQEASDEQASDEGDAAPESSDEASGNSDEQGGSSSAEGDEASGDEEGDDDPGAEETARDMRELEDEPGATDPLELTKVPAHEEHVDLAGEPGPSPGAGPNDAPLKVWVFSDFQCPVCKRAVEPMKQLRKELGDDVQIVFLHNALKMHPQAEIASRAAIAAFRQDAFWAYHDKLFKNQRNLRRPDLIMYARELDLDVEQFKKDMDSDSAKAQVKYERALAKKLDMKGTPGFLINGESMVGWGSYGGFESLAKRELERAERLGGEDLSGEELARKATMKAGDKGATFAEHVWGMTSED